MVKQLRCLIILLCFNSTLCWAQTAADSVKASRTAFIKTQTVKADSLNYLALKLAQPSASSADYNQAIDLILKGLHVYSKFRDTTGIRESYNHLSLVYHLAKKYTQAKWFILQSNTLSRDGKDTLNIISSLITLAGIKEDIKDFALAKQDLTEAMSLARTRPGVDQQIDVQKGFVDYYTKKGDDKNAKLALSRIQYIKDSVVKQVAKQNKPTSTPSNGVDDSTFAKPIQVSQETASQRGFAVTTITLVTALLAGICLFFYRRSKK